MFVNQSTSHRYEIEVSAGDVLVVPPFWFHHVETLEDESISVNIWTDSPDYVLLHEIYDLPIPFEEDWDQWSMLQASRVLFSVVFDALWTNTSLSVFMTHLYKQRYELLYLNNEFERDLALEAQVKERCLPAAPALEEFPSFPQKTRPMMKKFLLMPDNGIRAICFGNWVEHVLSFIVSAQGVHPALQYCW
eukprot:m.31498 g.31498  ORF g.31498 m.31498 type:complete len:191 (-) comp14777_c0_seq1:55-627(-)